MVTELRRYAIARGRMDAMHARMTGLLFPIFAEQGVPTPTAIWDDRDETSTLTWIVRWDGFEQRLVTWARVAPVFAAARLAAGGTEFVTRTTLTLVAPWAPDALDLPAGAGRCKSLWRIRPPVGAGAGFAAACAAEGFALFRELGAIHAAGFNLIFGDLPEAVVLVSWPDAATRARAGLAAQAMPAGLAAALGGGAVLGDHGAWSALTRAPYLPGWA